MTIEFDAHVMSITLRTSDRVRVVLSTGSIRMENREIVLEMSRAEAMHYLPGSNVRIQFRPSGEVGAPFPPLSEQRSEKP